MRPWRCWSQSKAAYRSFASASATPSSCANVVVCHTRVVASFEHGSNSRCAIIASTRARSRQGRAASSASMPTVRITPSTALYMAVRDGPLDGEDLLVRDQRHAAQRQAQSRDGLGRTLREIGEGGLHDSSRRRAATGARARRGATSGWARRLYTWPHDTPILAKYKPQQLILHGYISPHKPGTNLHKRQCSWGQSKKKAVRSGLNAGLRGRR